MSSARGGAGSCPLPLRLRRAPLARSALKVADGVAVRDEVGVSGQRRRNANRRVGRRRARGLASDVLRAGFRRRRLHLDRKRCRQILAILSDRNRCLRRAHVSYLGDDVALSVTAVRSWRSERAERIRGLRRFQSVARGRRRAER